MFFLIIPNLQRSTARQEWQHQQRQFLNPNTAAWIWLNFRHIGWKEYRMVTSRKQFQVGTSSPQYVSRIPGMTKKKDRKQKRKKRPTRRERLRAGPKRNQQRCDAHSASFACSAASHSQPVRRITRKAVRNLVQESHARLFSSNNAPDAVKLDIRRNTARVNTGWRPKRIKSHLTAVHSV